MTNEQKCPKCQSENIYADGNLWVCPECAHEWSQFAKSIGDDEADARASAPEFKDAHGNPLQDGDSVTVIKELRIKGSSSVVKVGTKVKNIRLGDAGDGHDIMCKIDGIGSINLKTEYVKKA